MGSYKGIVDYAEKLGVALFGSDKESIEVQVELTQNCKQFMEQINLLGDIKIKLTKKDIEEINQAIAREIDQESINELKDCRMVRELLEEQDRNMIEHPLRKHLFGPTSSWQPVGTMP